MPIFLVKEFSLTIIIFIKLFIKGISMKKYIYLSLCAFVLGITSLSNAMNPGEDPYSLDQKAIYQKAKKAVQSEKNEERKRLIETMKGQNLLPRRLFSAVSSD